VRANVLDVRRAREHLGWQPSVSLEEGLKRTWTWVLDQEQI
jgi:UDP-glucose 4-epimerase